MPQKQVVAVVIERDGRFLVGRRGPGKLTAPGYWCPIIGGIEPGESEEQAVRREALEEAGIEVEPIRKLGSLETRDRAALMHWWRARIVAGEPYLADDEHTELRWVTMAELRKLEPVFEEDLEFFER